MQSTHAADRSREAGLAAVCAAIEAVTGRRPEPGDRLEADLAIDSLELAAIAAAVPFDLNARLAGFDFERLVSLTVAELVP